MGEAGGGHYYPDSEDEARQSRQERQMAYGKIITQEQAEGAYHLLGKWRAKNDPDMSDDDAERLWDFLRFVLQYDEATPAEFIENQGFAEDEEDEDG